MIIVASSNGKVGIKAAMQILRTGGTALDAVEAGIRLVEDNPADHSVGYGGLPNILGEVELDASVMEGRELKSGAVGAVKGFANPISIARKVMETLPHVFLVGEGAQRFAEEMGFKRSELLTPEAQSIWEQRLRETLPADVVGHLTTRGQVADWTKQVLDVRKSKGTVNFLARDAAGDLVGGVSTSGWGWKYPGRLGDSPVIGAGNYVDNRYGAAACTGMGEMAIRGATAHSVVFYMKMGFSLEDAGRQAMKDLDDLGGKYLDGMNIVALDKDGRPAGFSNNPGEMFIYMTETMEEPIEAPRIIIPNRKRWG
jgi:beta-aspartyl-peptidase (threonine type)